MLTLPVRLLRLYLTWVKELIYPNWGKIVEPIDRVGVMIFAVFFAFAAAVVMTGIGWLVINYTLPTLGAAAILAIGYAKRHELWVFFKRQEDKFLKFFDSL